MLTVLRSLVTLTTYSFRSTCGTHPEGRFILRIDGRATDQLRPVKITPDFIPHAEGSALIESGHTRVIVTATVEDGVPGFLKGSGKGWVTGEYGMLPRSTESRTPRESSRGKQSGRTLEIQRLIGRTLRAVMGSEGAWRAHRLARLRRDSGGWRHSHRFDYRRVRRAGPVAGAHGRRRNFAQAGHCRIIWPPPA